LIAKNSFSGILALHLILLEFKNKGLAKMKYSNAGKVLPENLILEIQKYVQGETLYIPKREAEHRKWGVSSGGRRLLDRRNAGIKASFRNGSSIEQLAEEHYLSTETIKKIVYSRKT
jgi:Mor family transcriptional regulator